MNNIKTHILALLVLLISTAGLSAQNIVKGHVADAQTGEALAGATVSLHGATRGVITNIDGFFTISVSELPTTLTINFVGYRQEDVDVYDNSEPVEVVLTESRNQLSEVVVVGYGTMKRQNLASSISSVKNEAFSDVPVSSFEQALQGRSSGIQITNPSGNLGTAPLVRVRGVASITSGTEPLYVVDGVAIYSGNLGYSGDTNVLSDINPDDIESINVLKDAAAAALYGSRAANGVVLITTKRGQQGHTKVTYNGYVGITSAVKLFDVLNAEEFVATKNLAVANRYGTDYFSLSSSAETTDGTKAFNLAYDADGNLIDTNWRDYVFQTGFQQSHSVSVEGGNDKASFHASANYLKQSGIVQGDLLKRIGTAFNADVHATKWLKLGTNQQLTSTNQRTADRSRGGAITAYMGFPRLAWANAPNIAPYDEDGNWSQEDGHLGYGPNTVQAPLDNPVAVLESGSFLRNENFRWLGTFYAELRPVKGLTLRSQYGRDYIRTEERNFFSPYVVNGASQNGVATNVSGRYKQYTFTNTATYDFSLKGHNLNVLFGFEMSEKEQKYWGAKRTDLVDDTYTIYEASFQNITAIDSYISESGLVSFFGRINYDYNSRYILSLNLRRDGYSALSKDHRWGNFGGVSAAWRVSDEPFFHKARRTITDLKVKAGWGIVGNTNVDDYASKSYYSSDYYGTGGAYVLSQIGDSQNLKWESSSKFDIGFEATLWDNITIEFDYYANKSSDLILEVPVSPSAGVPNNYIISNAGAMKNTGIELTIGADVIKKKHFQWTTSFNITTNRNRVTELSDGVDSFITEGSGETTNITMVGKSIGQLYLYPTNGIDESTGRRIFLGADGEEVLMYYEKSDKFYTRDGEAYSQSDIERVVAGNTLPTFYGGWTNNLRYRGFDLTLFFQFSGGNKIYNGTTATLSDVRFWNNSKEYMNNYWTTERTKAKYALPVYGDNYSCGSAMPITEWVERGDYIRLKNLVVGYTFKNRQLRGLGVSSLRLYAQAQNLFVITGYSGLDPEVLSQTQSATLCGGTDHNTAPQARTFTFGAQITF